METVEIKGREFHFIKNVINQQQMNGVHGAFTIEALTIPPHMSQYDMYFLNSLKDRGLLRYDNGRVYATDLATISMNEKQKRESRLIEEYIIDDFEYAFLMFMANRNEPVHLFDFPSNFKYHSKIDGQMIDGNPNHLNDWMNEIHMYITNPTTDGYVLTHTGKKRFEKLKSEKELNTERKNLEMQKLRTEVENLTNVLVDYPTTKWRAKYSFRLSILAIIISGLVLLLRWIQQKSS